jgi:hypothetical protein
VEQKKTYLSQEEGHRSEVQVVRMDLQEGLGALESNLKHQLVLGRERGERE